VTTVIRLLPVICACALAHAFAASGDPKAVEPGQPAPQSSAATSSATAPSPAAAPSEPAAPSPAAAPPSASSVTQGAANPSAGSTPDASPRQSGAAPAVSAPAKVVLVEFRDGCTTQADSRKGLQARRPWGRDALLPPRAVIGYAFPNENVQDIRATSPGRAAGQGCDEVCAANGRKSYG
jgi:hypothetical protein